MSHRFKHLLNSVRPNAKLRDCLPEIKDVRRAYENVIKQRAESCIAISTWGKAQDKDLADFIAAMCDCEGVLNAATNTFCNLYHDRFYSAWRSVLDDFSTLHDLESAHSKAHDKAKKAAEQVAKEEGKGDAAKAGLPALREKAAAADREEKEAHEKLERGYLAVHRTVYMKLRGAYYELYDAWMAYERVGAQVGERALACIRDLKIVSSFDESGAAQMAAFDTPAGPNLEPFWHKGEEFRLALETRPDVHAECQAAHAALLAQLQQATESAAHAQTAHLQALQKSAEAHLAELAIARTQSAARLAKTLIGDASNAASADSAEFLSHSATQALTALAKYKSDGDPENLPRSLVAAMIAHDVAVYALGDEAHANLKPTVSRLGAAATDCLTALEMSGFSGQQTTGALAPRDFPVLVRILEELVGASGTARVRADAASQEMAKNISGAQAAIQEALSMVKQLKEESSRNDTGEALRLNQDLLTDCVPLIEAARNIIDSGTAMQDSFSSSDAATSRKWTSVMTKAVDELLVGVPQWLLNLRAVIYKREKMDEFRVVTRSISACSAQLVAFVRTSAYAKGGASEIEANTAALQSKAHKVMDDATSISQAYLSSMALEDYSKLSQLEGTRLKYTTQAEIEGLQRQLERAQAKFRELQKLPYMSDA